PRRQRIGPDGDRRWGLAWRRRYRVAATGTHSGRTDRRTRTRWAERRAHTSRYVTHTKRDTTSSIGTGHDRRGVSSIPSVDRAYHVGDPLESRRREPCPFTAHRGRRQAQQPIHPHLRVTPLPVPGTCADVHPGRAVLVGVDLSVLRAVPRGHHQGAQHATGPVRATPGGGLFGQHQHRPILPPTEVLL